ncbi:MAG: NAD(P)H-binding protein, partial [Pseudomonadota bacterium]
MKLVTIGGSGFLGHHVARAFARAGHESVVLTRQPAPLGNFRLIPGVSVVGADVYDQATLVEHLRDADAAVSMAGILNESGRDGSGFMRVHRDLVATLVAAGKAAGVGRLLHVSALGAGAGDSHYQKSKGAAEALLAESGLDVTVFQPSVIFGNGDSFFN